MRFSRDGRSSQLFPHRDWRANRWASDIVNSPRSAKKAFGVPIGPKLRMVAVASPAYFAKHSAPKTPRDLVAHRCINIRFPTHGGLYVWEFERRGEQLNVRVDGQVVLNSTPQIVLAALAGLGIAFLPEEEFAPHIEEGRLVRVLQDWCAPFEGNYLYYPSRRHPSPAFSRVVDVLRFNERKHVTESNS